MVEIGSLVSIDINFIFKPVTNEFLSKWNLESLNVWWNRFCDRSKKGIKLILIFLSEVIKLAGPIFGGACRFSRAVLNMQSGQFRTRVFCLLCI